MKSFKDFFQPSSEKDRAHLETVFQSIVSRKVTKGTILLSKGDKVAKSFFVKKGLLRSYAIDAKGKEHIFTFAPEGWIISDIESQKTDFIATLYIDAIEDSEIEMIDRSLLSELPLESERSKMVLKKFLNRVAVLQRRIIMLLSYTAAERYEHFLETYPQIVNRVPQKMIASYLGITPEALSNIRRKGAKK